MYSIEYWLMRSDAAGLATRFSKAGRCHIAQTDVPPVVIIIHPPAVRNISQLINAQEQLSIKQFISESAVERLGITILPGVAWSNIQGFYAGSYEPFLNST